jgi:predicted RNA-binding protein associated with RNAse of E/G family
MPEPSAPINLQEPFRRTPIGIDTQDHELDVIVLTSGEWSVKDEDSLGRSDRGEMNRLTRRLSSMSRAVARRSRTAP